MLCLQKNKTAPRQKRSCGINKTSCNTPKQCQPVGTAPFHVRSRAGLKLFSVTWQAIVFCNGLKECLSERGSLENPISCPASGQGFEKRPTHFGCNKCLLTRNFPWQSQTGAGDTVFSFPSETPLCYKREKNTYFSFIYFVYPVFWAAASVCVHDGIMNTAGLFLAEERLFLRTGARVETAVTFSISPLLLHCKDVHTLLSRTWQVSGKNGWRATTGELFIQDRTPGLYHVVCCQNKPAKLCGCSFSLGHAHPLQMRMLAPGLCVEMPGGSRVSGQTGAVSDILTVGVGGFTDSRKPRAF